MAISHGMIKYHVMRVVQMRPQLQKPAVGRKSIQPSKKSKFKELPVRTRIQSRVPQQKTFTYTSKKLLQQC